MVREKYEEQIARIVIAQDLENDEISTESFFYFFQLQLKNRKQFLPVQSQKSFENNIQRFLLFLSGSFS